MVAPTPPARTKPAPSALAAVSGSFPRRSAASPMPVRRSSTAPASWSRSVAMSRRTSSVERSLASAIANRFRRQLGFSNRLLRHRRRPLLDRAEASEEKNHGKKDERPADDQKRGPHRENECKRHCRGGEPEAEREESEDAGRDRHADADAEGRDLALDLEKRELELEPCERAGVLGNVLGGRADAVVSLLGGH